MLTAFDTLLQTVVTADSAAVNSDNEPKKKARTKAVRACGSVKENGSFQCRIIGISVIRSLEQPYGISV